VRTTDRLFVSYETGEHELYDLVADPAELENLAGSRPALEAHLGTTLRGLCDPPPPGFRNGGGPIVVFVALAATLALAGVARWSLTAMGRG
jgi:hypothetical protein